MATKPSFVSEEQEQRVRELAAAHVELFVEQLLDETPDVDDDQHRALCGWLLSALSDAAKLS